MATDARSKTALSARRHWLPRVRFSLRSLILFTLLAGCAGLLWRNWGPWGLVLRVDAPGNIQNVWFSDDDQFVIVEYPEQDAATKAPLTCFDVRLAEDGTRHGIVRAPHASYSEMIGDYVWYDTSTQNHTGATRMFNFRTLQEVPLNGLSARFSAQFALSQSKDKKYQVWRLPDLQPVAQTIPDDVEVSLDKSDHLILAFEKHLEIRDLNSGRVVRTPEFNASEHTQVRGPIIVNTALNASAGGKSDTICIFDAATGAQLLNTKGQWFSASEDGRTLAIADNNVPERLFKLPTTEGAETGTLYSEISPDGTLIANGQTVRDTVTLATLWTHTTTRDSPQFSADSRFLRVREEHRMWLADARTGKCLLEFGPGNSAGLLPESAVVQFGNRSSIFSTRTFFIHCFAGMDKPEERIATVWRLRRPVEWHGFVWLPEFWVCVAMAGVFVWSVGRDWRKGVA